MDSNINIITIFGAIGYFGIACYALEKFITNCKKGIYMHMTYNCALLISSIFLSIYYYKQAIYNQDDVNNLKQRYNKIIGHSLYVIYIIIAFLSYNKSLSHQYDLVGLIGHGLLLYASLKYTTHLYGVLFLTLYFALKAYSYKYISMFQVIINIILFVNYFILFIFDYIEEKHEKHKKHEKNEKHEKHKKHN